MYNVIYNVEKKIKKKNIALHSASKFFTGSVQTQKKELLLLTLFCGWIGGKKKSLTLAECHQKSPEVRSLHI